MKPEFVDFTEIEDAKLFAETKGLAVAKEPNYAIMGIRGGVAVYDTTRITGYHLEPRGLIQKICGGWCVMYYPPEEETTK